MKKLFVVSMLVLTSLTTQASLLDEEGPISQFSKSDERSYYDVLGSMYKNATTPVLSKLTKKVFTGRCFHKNEPNMPENALYLIKSEKVDAGPIVKTTYKARTLVLENQVPNYFDDKSWELLNSPEFWAQFGMAKDEYKDLILKKDAFTITEIVAVSERGTIWTGVSSLKQNGRYLIEENANVMKRDGVMTKNTTIARCYYFKNQTN